MWFVLSCCAFANAGTEQGVAAQDASCFAEVTITDQGRPTAVVVESTHANCPPDAQSKTRHALMERRWPAPHSNADHKIDVEYIIKDVPVESRSVEDLGLAMATTATDKLQLAAKHTEAKNRNYARLVLEAAKREHGHQLEAAEIRYRYAKTYLDEESWKLAIGAFNEVVRNHPDTDWTCLSYLGQSQSLQALGHHDLADALYQKTAACRVD